MADDFLLQAQHRIWTSTLTTPEKVTAQVLLAHWSRTGHVFPSVARIAAWTSQGRATVIRAIASLEAKGAIRCIRSPGRATHYDVTPLASLPVSERDRSQRDTGITVIPNPSHSEPGPVSERDPNRSKNRSKKGSSSASQSSAAPLAPESSPSTRRKSKPATEAPDPRVTELRDHYVAAYVAAKGAQPVLTGKQWPRAMLALKELLAATKDLEAAKGIITRALDDEWHRQNQCQPWEIVRNANKFIGAPPKKTKGRPVQNHGTDPFAGARIL